MSRTAIRTRVLWASVIVATGIAGVAGGVLLGVHGFGLPAPAAATEARSETPETSFPGASIAPVQVNENGDTFGSAAHDPIPDLILVETDQGGEGYVYGTDITGRRPASPDQAVQMTKEQGLDERSITAYESDGETVVGTFTLNTGLKIDE